MEVAASPLPEAVASADPPAKVDIQPAAASPPPEAAAAAVPPANEDSQHAATVDAPPESAAPADSPAKEEIHSAAPADAPGSDAGAFCLYMKGGGCKEEFMEWEKCVEEADAEGDSNVVERCGKLMTALGGCMYNYPDYHEPILRNLVHPKIWQEDVPM